MKHTGPGLIDKSPNAHPPRLLLYNFDVDGSNLKAEHERALFSSVIPTLRAGGSVSIVGLASRSGSMGHNRQLSLKRANSVLGVLRRSVPRGFNLRAYYGDMRASNRAYGLGEREAKLEGYRDGKEDPRFRSVLVFVWSRAVPPRPNVPNDVLLNEMPEITSGLEGAEKVARWLEMGEKGLDGVHYAVEGTGVAAEAAGVVIEAAELIEAGNVAVEGIALILSLPATWLSGFAAAKRNGRTFGFASAMQSMADAVANGQPSIPRPSPKFNAVPDNAVSVAERLGREGQREGYDLAYSQMKQLDNSPKDITLKDGQKLRLSGRKLLLLLHGAFGDDIKDRLEKKYGWDT
jgi:hypothetical protein